MAEPNEATARAVQEYANERMRTTMNLIARGTVVLLPVAAFLLGALTLWLAVTNVLALHGYLVQAGFMVSWGAPLMQEVFIVVGETIVILNAVALRSVRFLVLGYLMTLAGNGSALWWHIMHAHGPARIGLVMIVAGAALGILAFSAIVQACITRVAVHEARTIVHEAPPARPARPVRRAVPAAPSKVVRVPVHVTAQDVPVTVADAVRATGVHDATIRSWLRRGHLTNRNPDGEPPRVFIRDVIERNAKVATP